MSDKNLEERKNIEYTKEKWSEIETSFLCEYKKTKRLFEEMDPYLSKIGLGKYVSKNEAELERALNRFNRLIEDAEVK